MTCALPCWITGCPLSVSIQLSFHSLRQVSVPFRRILLKLSYHLPELPKLSFDMCCLSPSLSLSPILTPASFFISLLLGTVYSPLPPPLLLIHPCKACQRATLLSVSLHPPGFQKPQRHQWFTGWPSSATSKGWLAQFLLYISVIVIWSVLYSRIRWLLKYRLWSHDLIMPIKSLHALIIIRYVILL